MCGKKKKKKRQDKKNHFLVSISLHYTPIAQQLALLKILASTQLFFFFFFFYSWVSYREALNCTNWRSLKVHGMLWNVLDRKYDNGFHVCGISICIFSCFFSASFSSRFCKSCKKQLLRQQLSMKEKKNLITVKASTPTILRALALA